MFYHPGRPDQNLKTTVFYLHHHHCPSWSFIFEGYFPFNLFLFLFALPCTSSRILQFISTNGHSKGWAIDHYESAPQSPPYLKNHQHNRGQPSLSLNSFLVTPLEIVFQPHTFPYLETCPHYGKVGKVSWTGGSLLPLMP